MFHQFPLLVLYKTFHAHFLSDGKMQQGKVKSCMRAGFFLGATAAPVFIQNGPEACMALIDQAWSQLRSSIGITSSANRSGLVAATQLARSLATGHSIGITSSTGEPEACMALIDQARSWLHS